MQSSISTKQKADLALATKHRGRGKWFCEGAGISWQSLQRLRTLGRADEMVVHKAVSFLEQDETQEFIARSRRAVKIAA